MIRKKKKHEQHENHERWLVSYADFITLLFAFFVVMYATSTNNVDKQKEFENSVRANLHLSVGMSSGGGGGSVSTAINEAMQELNQPIDTFPKSGSPKEIKDFLQRRMEKSGDTNLKSSLSDLKHEWYGVRMSLAASSFFEPGSYKLKLSSLKIIDELMKNLENSNNRIIIEGHTDNMPIKSSTVESNWELSSLRATSVVRYLIKYHNMDPKMITAAAYADTKPVAPNDNEDNRAKNRRIDFLIISDEKLNKQGL